MTLTFIIPTIGRKSLARTLLSLVDQTSGDWRALVICDGPEIIVDNIYPSKISTVSTPVKIGKNTNNAGLVRNYGMDIVRKWSIEDGYKCEWFAFVDDDDTLDDTYVERFYEEIATNEGQEADVVVFRMNDRGKVIPPLFINDFEVGEIGISFIIKNKVNVKFTPSGIEDFLLLNWMRKMGFKIIISQYVLYYVNDSVHNGLIHGNRVLINYNNSKNTLLAYLLLSLLEK